MNQLLSNKIISGIVVLALLVGVGVLISSGDTSSTTRNAALVVATPCTKPGQVTKVSKQSVVCAKTNTGSLWYATMKAKGKAQPCTKPGAIRKKSKIVWVCGVVKKKKLWQATQPLPPAVVASTTVIETGATQPTPALDSTQVATPDAPVVADNTVLADTKIPDDKIVTQVIEDVTPATTPTVAPTTPTVAPTTPTVAPTTPTVAPTTPTVAPSTPPAILMACAAGGPCAIGDAGPGGGTVFYVAAATPFKCGKDLTATCTRLEAAPNDFSTGLAPDDMNSEYSGLMWGGGGYAGGSCGTKAISGAQRTSIGSGFANTAAIMKACPDESGNNSAPAAREASNYALSGKAGGWFLPSKDELNELCKYAHQTGQAVGGEVVCSGGKLRTGFAYDGYWSSSEYKATNSMYAWVQYFTSANTQAIDYRAQHIITKSYPYYVRPVRAF